MGEKKTEILSKEDFLNSIDYGKFENKNQALAAEIAYSLYVLRSKK